LKIYIKIVLVFSISVPLIVGQSRWENLRQNLNLDYPVISVIINSNPSPEFLFLGATTSSAGHLLILDNDLTPLFYKKVLNGSIFDFKLQRNGKLTYNIVSSSSSVCSFGIDNHGIVDKQYVAPPGFDLDIHDLQVMADSTYYIFGRDYVTIDMSQYVLGGDTAAILTAQTIHHMDANNVEIWRWNSLDHYDILDVADFIDLTAHTIDWTHCNSIDVDPDGNLIISTKNFNEVTKISRQTGEIIWRLGGERNQFQFINDNRGFGGQHDARVLSNGNIALFDNGLFLIPEYSSYVEYEIDEQNYTATLIRRYSHNCSIYAQRGGGVQELPNGNILISWDAVQYPIVTEINAEDSIVYEVKYDNHVAQYRAKKYFWKTNLFSLQYDSLDFGYASVGDSSEIDMKIYNSNDQPVLINEIFNNESAFSVNEILPIEIPPIDSVEVKLVFKPTEHGSFTDKINFRYVTDTLLLAQQIFVQGETENVVKAEELAQAIGYSLSQNYPNPFNPSTTIKYSVPEYGAVKLSVYNLLGERVAILVNETLAAGEYKAVFNTTKLPSGVYIAKLESGNNLLLIKMILSK